MQVAQIFGSDAEVEVQPNGSKPNIYAFSTSISPHALAIFSAQCAAVKQCFPQGPGLNNNPSRINFSASSLVGNIACTFFLFYLPFQN